MRCVLFERALVWKKSTQNSSKVFRFQIGHSFKKTTTQSKQGRGVWHKPADFGSHFKTNGSFELLQGKLFFTVFLLIDDLLALSLKCITYIDVLCLWLGAYCEKKNDVDVYFYVGPPRFVWLTEGATNFWQPNPHLTESWRLTHDYIPW